MSVDSASAIWLCAAKGLGVDYSRTLTIGRQSFWPDESTLQRIFTILGVEDDARRFLREHDFAEGFLQLLGARDPRSLDFSGFENASLVHDMNVPVPVDLHEQFSHVHDGGCIEHVFNAVQAFKNCMDMVEVGGHFSQVSVANNFTGHGFWQLSPELLFRIFASCNGFEIRAVFLHDVMGGHWYSVADPEKLRLRVELCNARPTYILTLARRVAKVPIFSQTPQQSDYADAWQRFVPNDPDGDAGGFSERERILKSWRRHIPGPLKRTLKGAWSDLRSIGSAAFAQPCYRRIDVDALMRGRLG